ncbi:MAG: hypothetical protein SPL98_01585, partial [Bacteroidales bacterium]|nr:hypothetical protein [Bacteroidales bacterium]MDY6402671.1 hypothetical protein [Bacteroidales bacterium]
MTKIKTIVNSLNYRIGFIDFIGNIYKIESLFVIKTFLPYYTSKKYCTFAVLKYSLIMWTLFKKEIN